MKKSLHDIKADSDNPQINLKKQKLSSFLADRFKLFKKPKSVIYKNKTPIKQVQDLSGEIPQNYQYFKGKSFHPPRFLGNLLRISLGGFIILFIVNSLNVYTTGQKLKGKIENEAAEGYSFLVDAGKSATKTQFDNALLAFNKALENFDQAQSDLWFITTDNSFYAEEGGIAAAIKVLFEGGKYFSIAGKYFVEAIEEFNKIPIYFVSKNHSDLSQKVSITDAIREGLNRTNLAITQISLAAEKLSKIDEDSLPPEVAGRITFAKEKTEEISALLTEVAEHFPALLKLLGDEHPHRYLILFQNNNEIRPTGGFIGSYGIMDINEGYIEKLETHDVYDIDGAYGALIEPPEELKSFTNNWRFRDSNYSPDFAVSAAKAKWFLEKEGGPSVDTVIAINQGLLQDMLEITGPVQVGNFGKLTSENYNLLLSFVIEGKIWGAEDPKHILKVFVPAFKDAILKEANLSKVGSKVFKAIQQKHILFYSPDQEIQALFDSFELSGRVSKSAEDEDYLSVIHSSTGGTKSDQFIEETITHATEVAANGRVTNELTIKRTHLWTDQIYFRWRKILQDYGFNTMPDQLIDILGRGHNVVNMRIYVPKGSTLVKSSVDGVQTKYDEDLDKTYFFVQMETLAGQTSLLKIKYELPFVLSLNQAAAAYKLVIEKQPGSRGSIFNKTFKVAPEISILNYYPSDSREEADRSLLYATNLVYDRYFATVLEK